MAVDTSGVLAGKTLTQIAVGGVFACVLDATGAVYCWGYNDYGQLGDGSTASYSSVPVAVDTSGVLAGKTLTQITAGWNQACALDSTGTAYCWGGDDFGELGNNSAVSSNIPVTVDSSGVLAGKPLTQIAAGWYHTCALDSTGAAYCWGDNTYGDLGNNNSTISSAAPVTVDTSGVLAGKSLAQIIAGYYTTCALDTAGAAYCWGINDDGQLGDASTAFEANVPVAVDTSGALAGKTLTQVNAGYDHTCALDTAGAVYCWGFNRYGDLGDGTTADSNAPVAVDTSGALSGKKLTEIADGGYDHACVLDSTGAIYCWGYNDLGQLGNDSTDTQSDVPVLAGPQAPTNVMATPGDTTAAMSWTAPASLDGGTLTGYTATASPGSKTCTTTGATTCTITGLADGTTYSVTVVADTTVGESGASAPASVTPGSVAFTNAPSDTVARQGRPVRLLRGLGFDRNPMRRGIDRIQAVLRAVLLAVFLAGAPFAAMSVSHATYVSGLRAGQAQLAAWHRVPAVVLRVTPIATGWSCSLWSPARLSVGWAAPGGSWQTGEVTVMGGAVAGRTMTVWIDHKAG